MKYKKYLVVIIIILIILLLIFLPKFFCGKKSDLPRDRNSNRKITVKALVLKPKVFEEKYITNGSILSNEEVEIKSEISGKITQLYLNEGSFVQKGTLLIKIYDLDLQANYQKIKSKEQVISEKAKRIKLLYEKNLASQEEYENINNELLATESDRKLIESQIEKTEIRAPFDGYIGLRYISPGSYITPTTRIASIQNINPLKVEFSIPQKYFSLLKNGKQVNIKIANYESTLIGKIYAIEPKIEQSTRTVKVRAMIPNPNNQIASGAYCQVEILLSSNPNSLLLPSECIVPDVTGEKVYKFSNGKANLTDVQIGLRNEKEIQILGGIELGDTIIVSGIINLKDKLPVKINLVK